MAFKDQVRKFEGRQVRVETVDGTFTGRLVEVKSNTITLRESDNRRTIIRNSKIVGVTEQDDC
ncbi:hypothetical protein T458_09645 [Brevibacillus panacihumi W25]|uniref:DUF2642 domain-containing protein n=1 Tax=Brevibacillus panacihumi W25 TaxID=1408254 RepID=V6MA88_9BACL|nr:DUF2642 domain-containing protein [Brevibacillus panacihumi]EST54790.1 hypothetical protein T458_09645 [Brevibacillus panacihumi W25]